MTYEEIFSKIKDALKAISISDFCESEWGVIPSIYIGIDAEDPPDATKYPVLAFLGVDKEYGDGSTEIKVSFSIFVGVYDDQKTETDSILEHNGLLREHELRNLVERSICNEFRGKSIITTQVIVENVFPFFSSEISFSLTMPRNSRVPARRLS